MAERKFCTVRFNLGKPEHKKAWSRLQNIDRKQFKSYSDIVIKAINKYFDDTDFEERLIKNIVFAVKSSISSQPITVTDEAETDNSDITWDFLGDDIEIQ